MRERLARRENFSDRTKAQLAKRAGNRCSFPGCAKTTAGANADGSGEINIGVAAHICAASEGGPRYVAEMTTAERTAASNGIWLCQDHAKIIDSDPKEFTREKLLEWKRLAQAASYRSVIHGADARTAPHTSGFKGVREAAKADLSVYRNTTRWPSTSVNLILEVSGIPEPVDTATLARIASQLDDLVLIAPPGMGKTTSLLQVAESILDRGGIPVFLPLSDWATESTSILESILGRSAFRNVSKAEFHNAAHDSGTVLLLDGWNELDGSSRRRAHVQISNLKGELPRLGLVISTRKQTLDLPFTGPKVSILPLNEDQQQEIASAMRGDAGLDTLDRAWRTKGLRELVSIPLYLNVLLSLPEEAPFPASKEEVLGIFVAAHDRAPFAAEALQATTQGQHQAYLEGLAVLATQSNTTTLSDFDARRVISSVGSQLIEDGQITERGQPEAVLGALVASHTLVRSGDIAGYSFQHQQFQEWYASHYVERRILADIHDDRRRLSLMIEAFDWPMWEEPILFAVERLSRGGPAARKACGDAIVAAYEVDPMLSAEMILRSSDEVWNLIASLIATSVKEWHVAGRVDRAVRCMITSGRPEFADVVWPLITHDDRSISSNAFMKSRRFRPSVLGSGLEEKIGRLPANIRRSVLHDLAYRGGLEGIEIATKLASHTPDGEIKLAVVEALVMRQANRQIADVLRDCDDQTLELIDAKGLIGEINDAEVARRFGQARARRVAKGIPPRESIRTIAYGNVEDAEVKLLRIIPTMEIKDHQDPALQYIYEVAQRYPNAVAEGILERARYGRNSFYGADDIVASAGLALEDEKLLEIALEGSERYDESGNIAASALGPKMAGKLISTFVQLNMTWHAMGERDRDSRKTLDALESRIHHLPGASLVAAIRSRAEAASIDEIDEYIDLIFRHPEDEETRESEVEKVRGRPFEDATRAEIKDLALRWGPRLLTVPEANRDQKAGIARLAIRAKSPELLTVLKLALDDNLERYRVFRAKAHASKWRDEAAVREAQHPLTHEYYRALLAIKDPATAEMVIGYLHDEHFGEYAARVLAEQWRFANEPPRKLRLIGGVDLADVPRKRREWLNAPDKTCKEAEDIFAAIDRLLTLNASEGNERLAVALGIVGCMLPHGQRKEMIDQLYKLAPLAARSKLLQSLVLSGREIPVDRVAKGVSDTLERAKEDKWLLDEEQGWELKGWLRLLSFADVPQITFEVIDMLPDAQRSPRFLEEMIDGFAFSPSADAEEVLFGLASKDPRFYESDRWRSTVIKIGTESIAFRLIELIAKGEFVTRSLDYWHFARAIGAFLDAYPNLRRRIYGLISSNPSSKGSMQLAEIVIECPDDEGILTLLDLDDARARSLLRSRAVDKVVTHHVPSESWRGAFEVVPVSAEKLRKELLARASDGKRGVLAANLLREIDDVRDRYGIPEGEPRHPDLLSGQRWPRA